MSRTKWFLILALVIIFRTNAQNNDTGSKPFIEVTGQSELEVSPDEIYIQIRLMEHGETKEKLNITTQEAQLVESLKELGIEPANLTVSAAEADYRKIRAFKKEVIVSKSYHLKLTNPELLGKLYESFDKINVNDAYVNRVSHSKLAELTKENRLKALKAAKDKVDYLLTAVGKRSGAALQINELDNVTTQPNNYNHIYARNAYLDNDKDPESAGVAFRKLKITSAFKVKYEILNN